VRSERWLTRRAARGDDEAFAAIFRRHQQDLYRYCVAILGDPDDAQDALQNTMVRALRALPGEDREIALKPWLYRIAHNEAIELRRRDRPTKPLADAVLPPTASLEQVAAERGRLRDLLADLAELPVRQRGALVMRELAGFDFEQIGAALETTPAAARQVLYEARRSLHEMGEGREMRCDAVTMILSEGDGRVARRRDLRAHLRDCADCRAFAKEIRSRGETLAAIAPLPAVAAAALIKSALAGSAGGAAAGGGATVGGGAGLAAGTAAKVSSTAALVKSAIGVAAVIVVGVAAADRTHLVHLGGSGGDPPAAKAASVAPAPGTDQAQRPSDLGASTDRGAEPGDAKRANVRDARPPALLDRRRASGTPAAADAPTTRAQAAPARSGSDLVDAPATTGPEKSDPGSGRQARGADNSASAAGSVHPEHPVHPTHPSHPAHPERPAHAATPVKPTPERPPHPGTAAPVEAATTTTEPAAVEETVPSESVPGQAHKEAREGEAEAEN
jgi:RNA polymerase sigma factor (sigma-70 family)